MENQTPKIDPQAKIAKGAVVLGDVTLGEKSSVFYHATIRADAAPIKIGRYTNIQDNCVLHTDLDKPQTIGDFVTIGHGAVVHCESIGDHSLIGMGAVLLTDARIGKNCIIGAGSLIPQGVEIPDGSVVMGNPGKVRRSIREEEIEANDRNAYFYAQEAENL